MAHVEITIPNIGAGSVIIPHNELDGLQGGTTNEYYHLTQEQYNNLENGYVPYTGATNSLLMGDNSISIGNPNIPTLIIKGTSITAGTSVGDVSGFVDTYFYKTIRELSLNYVNMGINARYVSPPTNASISFLNTKTDIPNASGFVSGSYLGLECLVNDSKADPALYNPTTYESDLTEVVQAAIDNGWNPANIILMNTAYYNPPSATWDVEENHDLFTAKMQAVAIAFGTQYYDGYYDFKTAYLADNSLLHTDVIHPTVAGHDYIATKFVEFLTTNSLFPSITNQDLIVRGTINGSFTKDWDTAYNRGDFRAFGLGEIKQISDFNSPVFNSFQSNTSFTSTNGPQSYLHSVWSFGRSSNFGGQLAVAYGNSSNGYGNPELYIRAKASASTWTAWRKMLHNDSIDATPTDGSTNPVSSNGIFDALATKSNLTGGNTFTGEQIIQDKLTIGLTPSLITNVSVNSSFAIDNNAITGFLYENKSTGTSAEMRFLVKANDTSYATLTNPGSNNSSTSLFGVTKSTSTFLFNTGRIFTTGTFDNHAYNIGTNNTIRFSITGAGNASFTNPLTVPTPTASTHAATKGYVDSMQAYSSKTANYTLVNTDRVVDLTANSATFTLPTAVGITGKQFTVKNSGSGTTLTLATTSSQTIDDTTTKTFNTQYSGCTIVSDGANWKIIALF